MLNASNVAALNQNLAFIVKRCIKGKAMTNESSTNYASGFSSILSLTADIFSKNPLNKKRSSCYSFVWSRFTKNLRDSESKKHFTVGADMHRTNYS